MSATCTLVPMTAIPSGELNWAGLLAEPAVPVPARVVTDPVAMSIFRIAWFPVSATKSEEPSVAIPFGVLNCAAVPVPLTEARRPGRAPGEGGHRAGGGYLADRVVPRVRHIEVGPHRREPLWIREQR